MRDIQKYIKMIEEANEGTTLLESYKDARDKFSSEEDENIVNQYLDTFKQLSKQDKIKGQNKDISYWIKQGWEPFKEFVDKASEQFSSTQVKKRKAFKTDDSIVLYQDEETIVVIPLTENASCYYGKHTHWCTAAQSEDNKFGAYVSAGLFPLSIITQDNGRFAPVLDVLNEKWYEIRDSDDGKISQLELTTSTGFTLEFIFKKAKPYFSELKKLSENKRFETPENAFYYAYINETPFPEGEDLIAQDGEYSAYYAIKVLNGRFKKGEDSIVEFIISENTPYYMKKYIDNLDRHSERLNENFERLIIRKSRFDSFQNYLDAIGYQPLGNVEDEIIKLLHNKDTGKYFIEIYLRDVYEQQNHDIANFLKKFKQEDIEKLIESPISLDVDVLKYIINTFNISEEKLLSLFENLKKSDTHDSTKLFLNSIKMLSNDMFNDFFHLNHIINLGFDYFELDKSNNNFQEKFIDIIKEKTLEVTYLKIFKQTSKRSLKSFVKHITKDDPYEQIIKIIIKREILDDTSQNFSKDSLLNKIDKEIINSLDDELKYKVVNNNGKTIEKIDDPSDELIRASLRSNPDYVFQIIKEREPTEKELQIAFKGAFEHDVHFEEIDKLEDYRYRLAKYVKNESLSKYFNFLMKQLEEEVDY